MRILYICRNNDILSPVAEALTRKFKPEFEVESAGTHASNSLINKIKDSLEKDDSLKYLKPSPDQLTQRAIDEADKIITMKRKQKNHIVRYHDVDSNKIEVWNVDDSRNPGISFEVSYMKLKNNVKNL